MSYRILNLVVTNFKGIEVIDITPESDIVQIQGKNDAGKTASINSIMVALEGTRGYSDLVKRGEDKSIIEIDFGEFKVKRVISAGRTSVQVSTEVMGKNVPIPSPAEFLKEKLNPLAMNPLAFTALSNKEQVEHLLEAFNVNISDLEEAYITLDTERKGLKDEVRTLEKRINLKFNLKKLAENNNVKVPASANFLDTWDRLIEAKIPELEVKEVGEMTELLAYIDELKEKRALANSMQEELKGIPAQVLSLEAQKERVESRRKAEADRVAQRKTSITNEIERLKAEIARLEKEQVELENADIHSQFDAELAEIDEEITEYKEREAELAAIGILGKLEIINDKIAEVNTSISQHTADNTMNQEKKQALEEVEYIRKQRELIAECTEKMEANREEQRARLNAAKIPIEGLEITPEGIMIGNSLFANLSESVRLKTALQIVKAKDPEIKVITIEAGSGIDESNLKILTDFAKEGGYQIWIEQVREIPTPGNGFYLEAGEVLTEDEKKERLKALLQ